MNDGFPLSAPVAAGEEWWGEMINLVLSVVTFLTRHLRGDVMITLKFGEKAGIRDVDLKVTRFRKEDSIQQRQLATYIIVPENS